jgi:hypothetical protein
MIMMIMIMMMTDAPAQNDLVMTPATLLTFPRPIDQHPESHLLPTSHHGFDREGRFINFKVTNRSRVDCAVLSCEEL